MTGAENSDLFDTLIALADDHLILGHRLSEWCGHAPMLEEDLSLPNMALDLIGQSRNLYTYAGKIESKGRDEDQLAYLRSDRDYHNCLMVERPNGDFAHTILKQFYFAAFMEPFWEGVAAGADDTLRGIAQKAVKEMRYHIRHTGEWIVRMGDGTEESATRMRQAVHALHIYTDELFRYTAAMESCASRNVIPNSADVAIAWNATVKDVFGQAFLTAPDVEFPQEGGRDGRHTEDFGHLLAELQYMQRAYPGLSW